MGPVQPPTSSAIRPGVFTKSIVRSPACKFILHARVRHRDYNDVVFVGEDFIHVKQVKHNGHLEHIATKDDFCGRIRAAKTLNLEHDSPDSRDDDFIKREQTDGDVARAQQSRPPQLIVLTLDSDALIFLYLEDHGSGTPTFRHQSLLFIIYDQPIYKLGAHLAVDPFSRAVAVAANEREIAIYAGKRTGQVQDEIASGNPDWSPVTSERLFSLHGVIQHLEFLHPPDKDPDHIILLVIMIEQRRTKAVRIDWYGRSDLGRAQAHDPQPIDTARTVPSLLVPLREASFLLITGSEMKLQKDILSGSMRSVVLSPGDELPSYPGSSARKPVWTSWCKPLRNRSARQGQDILHLVREDGLVMLATITSHDTIHTSHAGDLRCHVGTAFASLGDPEDPDILAVVGDMSDGRVVHMGNWPSTGLIANASRLQTMEMRDSETLSNWASCSDLVISNLPRSLSRSMRTIDAVFVASCRQPYGSVTELRNGLEARLATYIPLDGLKSSTGAWVLPNIFTSSILILLSSPSATRLFDITPDVEGVTELDQTEATALVLSGRTLTASALSNGHLLQVSERSISTSANIMSNFEDLSRWDAPDECTIIAASIEPTHDCVIAMARSDKGSTLLAFKHRTPIPEDEDDEDTREGLQLFKPETLSEEPICLATNVVGDRVIGVSATVDGKLQVFMFSAKASPALALLDSIQIIEDEQSLCDNIVLLSSTSADSHSRHLIAICGLRDGRVVSVEIDTAGSPIFNDTKSVDFGRETVKLHRPASDPSKAYAASGLETCVITWDGPSTRSLNMQNLWMSDLARPDMAQGAVAAISSVPSSEYLSGTEHIGSLANSLVFITSAEICFASVDQTTTTVPRQIPVSGAPTRLIYAEQIQNLVCASTSFDVRSFPSNKRNAQPEVRRQIWPVITFIPTDEELESYRFELQPGESVNALLEWSFQQSGKRYCFVMVGGSCMRRNQTQIGRIAFLQPSYRNWQIDNVKEGRSVTFDDPVYALALYDELTYIVCTGSTVLLSRFDTTERKWQNICSPFKLSSRGTSISVSRPLIYISTSEDSLVTLRLEDLNSRAANEDHTHGLTLVAQAPRIDNSLDHTIVPLAEGESNIALLSTMDNLLLGLTSPLPTSLNRHRTRLLFEAALPQSLVRITQGATRPLWRPASPQGVLASNIIGLSADGSMTGIALLDEPLWRRLFWLQRVLEWSKDISPHMPNPTYDVTDEVCRGRERGFPIGLRSAMKGRDIDEIALFCADDIGPEADLHIDGNVLARVLERDGVERLKAALRSMAERQDRVGEWVRRHLDGELEAVEDVVGEVRVLVDMWM